MSTFISSTNATYNATYDAATDANASTNANNATYHATHSITHEGTGTRNSRDIPGWKAQEVLHGSWQQGRPMQQEESW
jgi:hypothetical protein